MRGSSSGASAQGTLPEEYEDDNESKITLTPSLGAGKGPEEREALPPPNLKVKRVDNYYSRWSRNWKYRVCLMVYISRP